MGTAGTEAGATVLPLEIRLLGPAAVRRRGEPVPLPPSRKVRALLGFLALQPRPVERSRLCELLWDAPDDPRGELRWCLSRLRRVLDEPGRARVIARGDAIALDLAGAFVDALEVVRHTSPAVSAADPARLRDLLPLFDGDLLAGLELDRSPEFASWLTAERRRFRGRHVAVVERLASEPGNERFALLERWLHLAPFDLRVHERLLQALAGAGRFDEGDAHVAAAVRRFEDEGLDGTPLGAAWRRARADATRAVDVRLGAATQGAAAPEDAGDRRSRRASVAVLPFADGAGERGGWADGLVADVITRLAKLRSLFVIAAGTTFALRDRGVPADEAARTLGVDYVVTGTVRRRGDRLAVGVELAEARTARVAWTDVFEARGGDALPLLDDVGDRIVGAIAAEIENVERNRAVLKPPNSLDAWEALHRGLWHAYRFSREDNELARQLFRRAAQLDPTFARAHAALSFTHWQCAFQGWGSAEDEVARAFDSAGQALLADDRDPAAHYAMGRALWLRGEHDASRLELGRAVDLSPNFAQGHYAIAFVESQAGDPRAALDSADRSRELSPFDPMLFGIFGSKAMAHVRLGDAAAAADWAVKAAARPNAHAHIVAIAALCLSLSGAPVPARDYWARLQRQVPGYRVADFLRAFRFDAAGRDAFLGAAARLGAG